MLVVAAFGKKYLPTTLQAFLVRTKKLVAHIGWERLPKIADRPAAILQCRPTGAGAGAGAGVARVWLAQTLGKTVEKTERALCRGRFN